MIVLRTKEEVEDAIGTPIIDPTHDRAAVCKWIDDKTVRKYYWQKTGDGMWREYYDDWVVTSSGLMPIESL